MLHLYKMLVYILKVVLKAELYDSSYTLYSHIYYMSGLSISFIYYIIGSVVNQIGFQGLGRLWVYGSGFYNIRAILNVPLWY